MSSRLKLQKNTAVKKKAEQQVRHGFQTRMGMIALDHIPNWLLELQALLAEQESEHALLFDSLKGTDPGTAGKLSPAGSLATCLLGCQDEWQIHKLHSCRQCALMAHNWFGLCSCRACL